MQPSQLNRKLNELRVASDIRQLVLNFLEECHQRVRVQDSKSNYEQSQTGVPQGTISRPLFWFTFVND